MSYAVAAVCLSFLAGMTATVALGWLDHARPYHASAWAIAACVWLGLAVWLAGR